MSSFIDNKFYLYLFKFNVYIVVTLLLFLVK